MIGCGSSTSTKPVDGESKSDAKNAVPTDNEPPKKGARDMKEYTNQLKHSTPYQIAEFKKTLKATEYEADQRYPEFFRFVVIEVPRVYLKDDVTGKGQWYTRARLTLNNPAPAKLNSKGGITSVPEPFGWAKVEMSN